MSQIKPGAKKALIALGIIVAFGGYKVALDKGVINGPGFLKSAVPVKIVTTDADVLAAKSDVKLVALPSTTLTALAKGPTVRFLIWEWNANIAALFANGGAYTTKGSLMEQNGVKVKFERQDDTDKMREAQVAFAQDYCKSGTDSSLGAHFVTIMGDQYAGYVGPANEALKASGADCQLESVGSFGYSRKEDKFMGPSEWATNPKAAIGQLVAGAKAEGDWNLFIRWAHENNIPFNSDEHTFDPNAVNWLNVTYLDAPKRYIAGYSETRKNKNKKTEDITLQVAGIVTWTPGDVIEAEGKGGLVSLMDTGSAIFQMPCIIVGLKKWNAAHADLVAGILAAAGEGADQVRANPAALRKAGDISAQVYKDQTGAYWVKYFNGVQVKDKQGIDIFLGGSAVSNIADEYQLFGLSGGPNLFKATYETFGKAVVQFYPDLLKEVPPFASVTNTRYLKMASEKSENVDKGAAEKVTYDSAPISKVTANRAYSVNFATGSADILPDSYQVLDEVVGYLASENTKISITGHTDNTGSHDTNVRLSLNRAAAVRQYFIGKGKLNPARVSSVGGKGPDEPVASNDTASGRAQNRRVAVILGR